jgi:acyl carrier protein phosphodiesterase
MDRINHLNKIKEYEKQIKQKCKMHRQVSYGYTTTNNPVKRQLAKSIQQQPLRDKPIARERVEDPYMHSIQLAQNRQLNDYVFKNADIFLTNIKTEQEEGQLTQELLAQGWRIQYDDKGKKVYVNANTMTSQEEYPTLRHQQTPTNIETEHQDKRQIIPEEEGQLTQELLAQGWRIQYDDKGKKVYVNANT